MRAQSFEGEATKIVTSMVGKLVGGPAEFAAEFIPGCYYIRFIEFVNPVRVFRY